MRVIGLKEPGRASSNLSITVSKDLKAIPAQTSAKITLNIDGAEPNTTTCISPAEELPDGLVIAYSRVSAPGVVEVKFTNTTGKEIDPVKMDFTITLLN